MGTSQCSCDLYRSGDDEKISRLRAKYEKQGWSGAKIERALADRPPSGFVGNLHPGFRQWLADSVREAGAAYLLVHWDLAPLGPMTPTRLSLAEWEDTVNPVLEEHLYRVKSGD